jgi:hypothetical protein
MRFIIQKIIRYVMDNQLQLHILNILLKKGIFLVYLMSLGYI